VAAVIAGLHFEDSIDLTAIGTLLLACATVGLARFARSALKASQLEINELREQGSLAHQPVIIPVFDHGRMDLGPRGTTERMPKLTDGPTLVVPAENIGAGPALRLCASAQLSPYADTPGDAPTHVALAQLMGVAKNSFVLLEFDVDRWPADPAFRLVVHYEDVSKHRWKTEGEWDPESKRWTNVDVKDLSKPVRGDTGTT
jgi:hypothetical protein